MEQPKLIAFYLPQYHPIPENDEWWGKGFTEWTNVTKAVPQFVGHKQPCLPADLGFYDLRLPDIRQQQAKLAKEYGIHGFCYYFYWFNGRRVLERPLNDVLESGDPDFPFCICWANENWTRRWDGLEKEILLEQNHILSEDNRFIFDAIPILQDPRYIRVDGKPVLLVYRPELLENPVETAKFWRNKCLEAGLPGLHLCAVEFRVFDPKTVGFDALVEFPPHQFPKKNITDSVVKLNHDFSGTVLDYYWGVQETIKRLRPSFKFYRGVMPSWDNTARRSERGTIFQHATPEIYRQWLRHVIQDTAQCAKEDQGFVFINAWNEWAEGAFLEPSQKSGRAWLEATQQAKNFTDYPTDLIDQMAHQSYLLSRQSMPSLPESLEPGRLVHQTTGQLTQALRQFTKLKSKLSRVKESLTTRGTQATVSLIVDRLQRKFQDQTQVALPQVAWSQDHHQNGINYSSARAILFVSHDAALAGAQLAILENLKHFTRFKEIDCYLLLCRGGRLESKFKKIVKTFNLENLTTTGLSRQAAINLVVQDIQARSPLMAFCNTVVTADVVEACDRAQIPVMSCIYELPASIEAYVGQKQFFKIIEFARRIIVASDYVQQELVDFYNLEPSKLTSIHAGIRQQRNIYNNRLEARKAILREFNFAEDTFLVLGCGSIHPRKGTDIFVQVAQQVMRYPDTGHVKFIWIGADQQGSLVRQWCEHDLRIGDLTETVLFIGERPEEKLDPYFAAADAFLLTSREDPFPLVNLTAMSHGLPVIAFAEAGGAPEALFPEAGVVVPYIDSGSMAKELMNLLHHPEVRHQISNAAMKKSQAQYQWSRYIQDLVAVMNTDFDCGITTVPKCSEEQQQAAL
ncbi:glycosyltransferase [Leptolyngbyaceae cyanobacterium CCMR0082]|uniref:Glycosyltransferase n=1 Tax=Adonisia turfae CCMR0082 TaxID=2304604 RepID=A0A6M0S410_9CYAN|nr:glycoside hydrolase family 99-like domain-containing protein [Adonisia turfae]NEZ63178.1 glycosyltransferase [Adonisia turfae CCMR0082]